MVVTNSEAKYYNRLYKFFQHTEIKSSLEIDYDIRKIYVDSLEKENISSKYRLELISLFDRLKIENMPEIYLENQSISIEQDFFKKDKLFLLYVPNKKKAQTFRKVRNKEELLWDFSNIHSAKLKKQIKIVLCGILNMDIDQRKRRYFLEPLKLLMQYCNKYGIDDIEEMEQADENRFCLYLSTQSETMKKQALTIIEFSRKTLFLTRPDINWKACVWYMDKFQLDKLRINASTPIQKMSFLNIHNKENREYLQSYVKYLIGISDMALSSIRNSLGYVSRFLQYLDESNKKVTELEIDDIEDYVSILNEQDIKYATFNQYILNIHTFFLFLNVKNIKVLKFYPKFFLKKGYTEHNNRSVPEETIAKIIEELPSFPEHLQVMFLILFCTGIRKSELCTVKAGAFYTNGKESWMRIYQIKMKNEKVIPIPRALVEIVEDYEKKYGKKRGEYLFKNKKGNAFNGETFSQQMVKECKKRGIDCGDYIFRAHDYRHNVATSLYEKGVSIQGVREYLGHASENMTKQYVDFMPERIVAAENKYFLKNQSFDLKGETNEREY